MGEPGQPIRKSFGDQAGRHRRAGAAACFALVTEGLAAATDSFLAADHEEAAPSPGRTCDIDAPRARDVEAAVERALLFQAPVAGDFHRLVTALRIVPELERSGDLRRAHRLQAATGLGSDLRPASGIIEQLGQQVVEHVAGRRRRLGRQGRLGRRPADRGATRSPAPSTSGCGTSWSRPACAPRWPWRWRSVARFYERLGDHAKHITQRRPARAQSAAAGASRRVCRLRRPGDRLRRWCRRFAAGHGGPGRGQAAEPTVEPKLATPVPKESAQEA